MKSSLRSTFSRLRQALAIGALGAATAVSAQTAGSDFPNRPVTLVVAFSAGGSNDILARALAEPLGRLLNVPVVVENRVGAAGMIGTAHVAKSRPDGYTLLVASASPMVVSPHTQPSMPFDAQKDFAPIGLLGVTPQVLALHPKVGAQDLRQLLELMRQRPISLASSGNGGLPHLALEMFKRAGGVPNVVHVPYSGAAPAVSDTVAGHVDGVVVDLPAVFRHIQSGRLRGVAVANPTRSEFLPDLPTSGEGGTPGFVAMNWIGLLAPAQTPPAVLGKIHRAVASAMQDAKLKAALQASAVDPVAANGPEEFRKFLQREHRQWGEVVKQAGLQPAP